MKKEFFKRLIRGQRGITGLETAIILIAFVVVASVFAYTVLSSGLFSTQKAQEAVYGGLEEAQSTLELKGVVVANGVAELNDCDYPLEWTASTNVNMARETTDVMEGSASMSVELTAGAAADETLVFHAMSTMDLTAGDTISFFIKAPVAIDSKLTFFIGPDDDIANATEEYLIDTDSANWELHTFALTGIDDDTAAVYGIALTTDDGDLDTFYVDSVRFDNVNSLGNEEVLLDSCDYPEGWRALDANVTLTRETTIKMEGTASAKIAVADAYDHTAEDVVLVHSMKTKDWKAGDKISFWFYGNTANSNDYQFVLSSAADLSVITESYTIPVAATGAWEKHTVTLTGDDDDAAGYYGIIALADPGVSEFYLDAFETAANLSDNNDPMLSYANELVITVANALGGEAIDFTQTIDTDEDGIISDETTKSHKVVVSYTDAYTQVTDLAWSKTSIGKDDGDALLEANEKFLLAIDLSYVNNNAGVLDQKQKIASNHQFQIEIKPHKGAVLTIERTLPIRVRNVMNLD